MKNFRGIVSAVFFVSWGAGLLVAAPIPNLPIRLSLNLPAQNIDFSDLDVRDENSQPVAARAQVIRRFEDVLNQNLNVLLIENLTPLRRAFLELMSREVDAFSDWMGRVHDAAERFFWTTAGRGVRLALPPRVALKVRTPALDSALHASANQFPSLAFLLISSTRLLC